MIRFTVKSEQTATAQNDMWIVCRTYSTVLSIDSTTSSEHKIGIPVLFPYLLRNLFDIELHTATWTSLHLGRLEFGRSVTKLILWNLLIKTSHQSRDLPQTNFRNKSNSVIYNICIVMPFKKLLWHRQSRPADSSRLHSPHPYDKLRNY